MVPVLTPRGLQGLFALYYSADAARPGEDVLAHIGSMARVLTGSLELAATLETVRGAERALEMALAGTASARGLEDVVNSLLELRERLATMRGRPGAPAWFVEEFARLAPSLSTALQAGRSLLAFSKGEIQQDTIYLDELLAEVGGETASVQIQPGAEAVWGDAALVRLALRAMVEQVGSGGDLGHPGDPRRARRGQGAPERRPHGRHASSRGRPRCRASAWAWCGASPSCTGAASPRRTCPARTTGSSSPFPRGSALLGLLPFGVPPHPAEEREPSALAFVGGGAGARGGAGLGPAGPGAPRPRRARPT